MVCVGFFGGLQQVVRYDERFCLAGVVAEIIPDASFEYFEHLEALRQSDVAETVVADGVAEHLEYIFLQGVGALLDEIGLMQREFFLVVLLECQQVASHLVDQLAFHIDDILSVVFAPDLADAEDVERMAGSLDTDGVGAFASRDQ